MAIFNETKKKSTQIFMRVFLCNHPLCHSEGAKKKYSTKGREASSYPRDMEIPDWDSNVISSSSHDLKEEIMFNSLNRHVGRQSECLLMPLNVIRATKCVI